MVIGGVIHVLSYDSVSLTSALRLVANVHAPVLFVRFVDRSKQRNVDITCDESAPYEVEK